jgi:hypothetical protein
MTEHYQSSHLRTSDITQRPEDDKFGPDGEMEETDTRSMGGQTETDIAEERFVPLLPSNEADQFRSRWNYIQANFVDDPDTSVQTADSLVAQVMKRGAEIFTEERDRLESQWRQGEEVSTEDMRVALQRYRSFFNRLLSLQ